MSGRLCPCVYHPIHEGKHRTLAWARIDLDWETGEVLIEEIQNDRLREVSYHVERIRRHNLKTISIYGQEVEAAFVLRYWNEQPAPFPAMVGRGHAQRHGELHRRRTRAQDHLLSQSG